MVTENTLLPSQPARTIKLWSPTAIAVLTFLLGYPAGITLAAVNWFKMGLNRKAFLHILGGIVVTALFFLLPENATRLLGLIINVGILAYLRQQMEIDIKKIQDASVQTAHWFGGCLAGLATWAVIAGAIFAFAMLGVVYESLIPGHAMYYSNRGDQNFNQGNNEQAIVEYTEAIRLDPTLPALYYNRGLAYSNMGEYNHAVSDFTQVITLSPEDADAYFQRGYNYAANGGFEAALADYSRVIELTPGDAYAYNNRGLIYEELGRVDEAIRDFEKVLEITTDTRLRQDVKEELEILNGQ